MLTPERMAELERVLTLIDDEEQERQRRGQFEMERKRLERARKQPPRPAVAKRWIVITNLPHPIKSELRA